MKTRSFFASALLGAFVGIQLGVAGAEAATPERDFGADVRSIFASKCTVCHGPDLVKPKARFGYVLDLKRVAENPEMVIPGEPDQSELWELVKRGEMPQPESPSGPLTAEQKETVRAWIAAGAPEPLTVAKVSPSPTEMQSQSTVPEPGSSAAIDRTLRWIGKFHFLLIHFPIALVFAAALGELRSIWRQNPIPSEADHYSLSLAAIFAVPTAVLGWVFAASGRGADSPDLLLAHRGLGTAAAVLLLITAALVQRDTNRGERSRRTRFLILFVALITALAAHLGGQMDRGIDFFAY